MNMRQATMNGRLPPAGRKDCDHRASPTPQRRIDAPLVERTAEARNGDGHRNQHQQE